MADFSHNAKKHKAENGQKIDQKRPPSDFWRLSQSPLTHTHALPLGLFHSFISTTFFTSNEKKHKKNNFTFINYLYLIVLFIVTSLF